MKKAGPVEGPLAPVKSPKKLRCRFPLAALDGVEKHQPRRPLLQFLQVREVSRTECVCLLSKAGFWSITG